MILYGQDNFKTRKFEISYSPCTPNYQTNTCTNQSYSETMNYLGPMPEFYVIQN